MPVKKKQRRNVVRMFFKTLYTLFALVAAGLILGTIIGLLQQMPNIRAIDEYRPNETSKVYAEDGRLIANLCVENREFVPITEIPQAVQDAVIAIEDARFYSHHGIDIRGIGRALVENFRRGGVRQGGSTITQQLARNIFLSQRRTMTRKIQEAILALQIERRYSKEEILELYLNQVYFGSGAYGIKTAAEVYYDKPVGKLNLAEASLLAGLPKAPSSYSPYNSMKLAKSRQAVVLERMVDLGFIEREEADEASDTRIKLAGLKTVGLSDNRAPYFISYFLFPLIDKYGADMVYKGGLRIETTLDLDMQESAEKAVEAGLKAGRNLNISQAALVAIDLKTGQIRAMVGGRSFKESQYNRAAQAKRQPGSAFKPFVYTTAIDSGMSPQDTIVDSPVSYGNARSIYKPKNYDGRFRGTLTLRRALEQSVNVPAVKLMNELGPTKVIDYARRMGITTISPSYDSNLAAALGGLTYGVTPIDMATAYGVIGNEGIKNQPNAILRITDRWGNVLESFQPRQERILRAETARTMADMLSGVISRGTGRSASIGYRAAGKTGTTSSYKDAWFVGFTDRLVTAVWVGNDNNRPMAHGVVGGTVPARIWSAFMRPAMRKELARRPLTKEDMPSAEHPSEAVAGKETESREESSSGKVLVQVCPDSGLLPTSECPEVVSRSVNKDAVPTARCNIHQGEGTAVRICDDTGRLANPYCPRTSLLVVAPGETAPASVCSTHKRRKPAQTETGPASPPKPTEAQAPETEAPRRAGTVVWQDVRFCALSGKPAGPKCPQTVVRRVRKDRIPQEKCDIHY